MGSLPPPTASPSYKDRADFEQAARGFLGKRTPSIIKTAQGVTAHNAELYSFFEADCPSTVNPKLWRYGQLLYKQGLYEVQPGIYQARGFDISNMTFIETETGVIVIDPLVSNETAAAALQLYWQIRGNRPVKAQIFSHSHLDHFGGGQGVVDASGGAEIPIIAPVGFMEEALSENTLVGPAMRLRSAYMRGAYLPRSPTGQVGDGLGLFMSVGTHSCLPPTILINATGVEHIIDGVRMIFQSVPGTEAPAEVNVYLPDQRALFISECATHTHHNILPLRGTVVRDAKLWSQGLDETLELYPDAEVLFGGHHWPTWGRADIYKLLTEQRDFYAYLHDQTIRMANTGMTGAEIAEHITLPDRFLTAWHLQGYYGSVSHNVKAIYQKYLGWFDGRPNTLWQYPAKEEGDRYAEAFGGVDQLVAAGRRFQGRQDLRFACTLLAHANYADPSHEGAKTALAACYEQLGFGAENATWRNFFLTGSAELLGKPRQAKGAVPLDLFAPTVPTDQMLAAVAVRIDGPRAAKQIPGEVFVDIEEGEYTWHICVSNGALTYRRRSTGPTGSASAGRVRLVKDQFVRMLKTKDVAEDMGSEEERNMLKQIVDVIEV